jgi:hypothetical protein
MFALFGLIPNNDPAAEDPSMAPDYSKDVVEVYKDVAKHFLVRRHSLANLEMVHDGIVPGNLRQLPSWVADWSAPMNADFFEDCPFRAGVPVIHQEGSQDQRVFLPSMPRQIHPVKLSEDGNTLEMIGKIVQTVLGTVLAETAIIPEIFPAPSANDAESSPRNRNEGQFSRFRVHVCYIQIFCAISVVQVTMP